MPPTSSARPEHRRESEVEVLAVSGVFDRIQAGQLRDRIVALAHSGGRRFVVDLSRVEVMTPEMISPLREAARRLEPVGGRVSIVFDPLLTVFAAEGLEDLYDVAVTREDAVRRILA